MDCMGWRVSVALFFLCSIRGPLCAGDRTPASRDAVLPDCRTKLSNTAQAKQLVAAAMQAEADGPPTVSGSSF